MLIWEESADGDPIAEFDFINVEVGVSEEIEWECDVLGGETAVAAGWLSLRACEGALLFREGDSLVESS